MRNFWRISLAPLFVLQCGFMTAHAEEGDRPVILKGVAAFGDWRADRPGIRRLITPNDMPRPFASPSASNDPRVITRPAGANLSVPNGFKANLFADGLDRPRLLRVAPNGDIFVAESYANRVRVIRPTADGSAPQQMSVFVKGLTLPFGINFYPPGPDPQWIYIANTDSVVRFAYRNGDLVVRGGPEVVVDSLPDGGHWTRDLVFSRDGARMFVSVGSASNLGVGMARKSAQGINEWDAKAGVSGAAWGGEARRGDVLIFNPDGKQGHIFATGLRNCVGLAVHPVSGDIWCSTNERDDLGDDLPPDYVTRVREGGFYGWPWYYIGDNEDPHLKGQRPDLRGKTIVPDVLLQAHSASLQMTFYTGSQFPQQYQGDAFAAEHGSWNRSRRTGYKIIRIILRDGIPTGEYEDFATGFVVGDRYVWGRPVGIDVGADGSLLMSEDGRGTIWRISYGERPK
jgi:glucose/arabinose dehydrogenase